MISIFFSTGVTALLFGATFSGGCKAEEKKAEEGMTLVTNTSANQAQHVKEVKELDL